MLAYRNGKIGRARTIRQRYGDLWRRKCSQCVNRMNGAKGRREQRERVKIMKRTERVHSESAESERERERERERGKRV